MQSDLIAGIDEAGRGPLAGPVVAAAVILDPLRPISGLADSKKLSAAKREHLTAIIKGTARAWCIAEASVAEIDQLNILQATLLAMRRALTGLDCVPELALIDGNRLPRDLPCPARALVRGDALEPCISAASILAKTHRDALLRECDKIYPAYGFARHMGYGTPQHLAALAEHGPTPIHRQSFAPVRQARRTL
ncbi:MAG: ribonuclease HII [Candidatus Competibacteraceae bacterium]|nr:ribonuclease HII [Candidatus Competibacteraceae bacterium]